MLMISLIFTCSLFKVFDQLVKYCNFILNILSSAVTCYLSSKGEKKRVKPTGRVCSEHSDIPTVADLSEECTYGLPVLITVIVLARKHQRAQKSVKIIQRQYSNDATFSCLPTCFSLFSCMSVHLSLSPSSSACVLLPDRSPLL